LLWEKFYGAETENRLRVTIGGGEAALSAAGEIAGVV
jgi:hypothetical protein